MTRRDSKWKAFDDESRYVDRFGWLLIITTLAVVTLSLVDLRAERDVRSQIGLVLVSIFVGATLLLALRASGVSRRYRIVADVLVSIGVLGTILLFVSTELLTELDDGFDPSAVQATETAPYLWVILSILAPVLVVRRVIQHRRATTKTLLGAVSAYLLIALAFNFAFIAVDVAQSTPFFGTEQPSTSFMYFSLVTVTTLGYGDLSAVEPFGRLLTTVEAVIGQVYLVIFVAMIVGLMVDQRRRAESRSE